MSEWIMAHMAEPKPENEHRTFLLRKYILLHAQKESLRRHISRDTSTSGLSSPQSPRSPTFEQQAPSPMEISNRAFDATSPGTEPENDQLRVVNQQLKATLTELLNSDSVKHDSNLRMWVQGRLMEAEMELKRQRRRMSSVSADTVDTFRNGIHNSAPV